MIMRGYWIPILLLVGLYAVIMVSPALRTDFVGLIASERLLARAYKAGVEGNSLQVVALAEQAVKIRPDKVSVWSRAGQLLLGAGEAEQGLEYLRKAAELDTGARAPLAYAWALSNQGASEESLQYYKKLLQRFPDDPQVLNDAGYMLVEMGQELDLALASLQHAMELEPASPFIVDSYGWALFKSKRLAEAVPYLEWAARRSPDSPEVQQHLAQALAHLGRVQEAQAASRRAMHPQSPGLMQKWLWSFQDHFAPDAPRV